MKFLNVFFLLLGSSEVSSFLSPSSRPHVIQPPFSFRDSLLQSEFEGSKIALQASAISGGNIITDDTEDAILLSSITVGAITAAMGFIYGKILALSLTTVWSTIPSLILKNTGQLNPAYFITGVCTLGGLILGLLSTKLHATFTVADFVSSFSSASIETLPSSSANLLPLLLLSLLTSTFGFSVGPEGA
jgi:H+/Cl- antiporter ClcA